VHEPTGDFSVIDCINQVVSTNDVTSCEDVWFLFVLHRVSVDDGFTG